MKGRRLRARGTIWEKLSYSNSKPRSKSPLWRSRRERSSLTSFLSTRIAPKETDARRHWLRQLLCSVPRISRRTCLCSMMSRRLSTCTVYWRTLTEKRVPWRLRLLRHWKWRKLRKRKNSRCIWTRFRRKRNLKRNRECLTYRSTRKRYKNKFRKRDWWSISRRLLRRLILQASLSLTLRTKQSPSTTMDLSRVQTA